MKNLTIFLLLFLVSSCSNSKFVYNKIRKNPDKKFILYTSDHEDPNNKEGSMNPYYESVYVLSNKQYELKDLRKRGMRMSTLGHKRSPIWNKDGSKIAYLSYSTSDTTGNALKKVIVQDINNGEIKIHEDTNPCTCGLSWDESGEMLVFGETGNIISALNLKNNSKHVLLNLDSRPENINISPNGKYIIFKTRDAEDRNDSDGWRPNLYNIENESLVKIGHINDKFGVHGNFWWKEDSSKVIFKGHSLDEQNKRINGVWSYNLENQKLNLSTDDFSKFHQQRVRYWKSDKIY